MKKRQIIEGSFGDRLYNQILYVGKPIYRITEETGIDAHVINSYKYSERLPMTQTLVKLCECLNVSANWLLWGIGKRELNE